MPTPPNDNLNHNWTEGHHHMLTGRPVTPQLEDILNASSSSNKIIKKSSRVPSKSEASALEQDTKGFLGRRTGVALRAAEYRPTLEKIKNTSFSDYVRGVMMGVPLDGVEYEEPHYNPDSTPTLEPKGTNVLPTHPVEKPFSPSTPCPTVKESLNTPTTTATVNSASSATTKKGSATTSPRMKTRSQSRPKKLTYDKTLTVEQLRALRARRRKRRPPPLQPCKYKMADGFAKITFPEGWWDKSGIARDTTARGRRWQKGTKLGDGPVLNPIKQCASGIGGVYEFTMVDQPTMTVAEFRDKADAYRKRQIGSSFDDDISDDFMDDMARKFWRRLGPTMEAPVYGADMEGTFFGNAHACGWNVNQLESCLQLLTVDSDTSDDASSDLRLPGVTTAYLYFGMWASVFAAHTEDKNLLSINYLHAGAPKYWYSISPDDSDRFESLMASHFSAAAAHCSEFLRHKRYLLSPSILNKAGIKYKTQIQRPGDAMITFPGSYHFGFNTGFNVAESTNFAVPEWYPIGAETNVCMCHPHSVRIDMNKFKELLDLYETDMITDGITKMSYSQWAKLETKLRRAKQFFESPNTNNKHHIYYDDAEQPLNKKLKTKGLVVQVRKMESRSPVGPPKKKQRSKKDNTKKEEDWRLALRVKPSILIHQTPVLCHMTCEKQGVEHFYAGIITDVVEGHVRIHFAGTGRKEDVWMSDNDPKIFLDAGLEERPSEESLENGLIYGKGSQKLKSRKT